MSSEQYWRLLGARQSPTWAGDSVPVIDYLKSREVGAGWWNATGAAEAGVYRAGLTAQVDPPVGGFATGDLLYVLPNAADAPTVAINSVAADGVANWFNPGIYRMWLLWVFSVGMTPSSQFQIVVAQRDDLSAINPRSPLPSRGVARWAFAKWNNTSTSGVPYETNFVALEPFKVQLRAATNLVDADIFSIIIRVDCLNPLDAPEGQ